MGCAMLATNNDASCEKRNILRSTLAFWFALMALGALSVILCRPIAAQESFLVSTSDGFLSLYDLASYTPLQMVRIGYPGASSLVASPNPRLAFVAASGIVADMSVARQVGTIPIVYGTIGAMTTDGKYLLIGSPGTLDFVDPAQFTLVKTVDLKSVLGSVQSGTIVVTASNAYVFPQFADPQPKVAVVNLSTYAVSSLSLPMGEFGSTPGANLAGVTPDGSTLVVLENESIDSQLHVVLISTTTNQIIGDHAQPNIANLTRGLAITPNGQDPSKIFGYVVVFGSDFEIAALDLRANSPTYGQILLNTAVPLDSTFGTQSMVVNSDGSRIIVVGSRADRELPQHADRRCRQDVYRPNARHHRESDGSGRGASDISLHGVFPDHPTEHRAYH